MESAGRALVRALSRRNKSRLFSEIRPIKSNKYPAIDDIADVIGHLSVGRI